MFATTRRALLAATAGLFVLPLAAIPAAAQDWPSGPVTIIVPFPPGGSVETVVRLTQPHLQERLGTNIVVDNRGGASGSIGAAAAANAAPDGNTWLFVFDTQAVNPALIPDLPFDSREDLDPVMLIGTAPNLLATHPDRPFETFEDVLDAAREAPGRVNYGTIGSGSLGHLTMILLEEDAGVELTHAPYSGGGPVINDAVAGHIDLVIGSAESPRPQWLTARQGSMASACSSASMARLYSRRARRTRPRVNHPCASCSSSATARRARSSASPIAASSTGLSK
jgi:tripartite-type tricarboxylate transporter receptor subunit TctC